jgi:ribosomal protein S18 acetylase RimI-like enzyme
MITYSDSLEGITAVDLEGFLAHWDFTPPAGTLLAMLRQSTVVLLARDHQTGAVCGYITALSDGVVCAYISALEVRPACRRQGIGKELLRGMIARLNVYGTYLSCAPPMVPFYAAAGFTKVAGMTRRRMAPPGSIESPAAAPVKGPAGH